MELRFKSMTSATFFCSLFVWERHGRHIVLHIGVTKLGGEVDEQCRVGFVRVIRAGCKFGRVSLEDTGLLVSLASFHREKRFLVARRDMC